MNGTRKWNQVKRWLVAVSCVVMSFPMFSPVTAKADQGPKASLRILFENMGDELCYGTLLSEKSSTGPSSAWDGEEKHARHNENENYSYETLNYETWKAFVEYEDADGYYFLQEGWVVSETKKIEWTYYPPNKFKILLYYPETGTFVVSDIYERYAFDTYYTVDMQGVRMGDVDYDENLSTDERIEAYRNDELSTNDRINAYRTYQYMREAAALVVRVLLTVAIELVIALFFGFRKKKQVLLLICANVVTQLLLNLMLNVMIYDFEETVVFYVLLEVLVFALEAFAYCKWMKKFAEKTKENWYYVVYALVANVASFVSGIYLVNVIPWVY